MGQETKEMHAALDGLVHRYQRAVFAVAYAKLGNIHDAEDITQDVFLEMYKNADKMNNQAKASAWLFRTTAYRCKDHFRKMSRRKRRELFSADSLFSSTQTEKMVEKERHDLVVKAIDLLPAKYRIVIMLRYFARSSYADISTMTGLAKSTIDGRLRTATKKLRNSLANMGIEVT
ncbi:MAG: RNA polymerase sigma factor [Candidatus Latescibacterota bacterium]